MKYKYIDINPSNAWSDVNEMVKDISSSGPKRNVKKSQHRYEYPLGNKNLLTLNFYKKYFITMKEGSQIKGMASLTIKDIFVKGKINKVVYLSDLKVSNDFCISGKRQWRNAFLDLILNKDKIEEIKDCEFFYGLIDIENDQTKNLFSRFEKLINIDFINNYSIHNIFSKKSDIKADKKFIINTSTIEQRDELVKFTMDQVMKQKWCDSPRINFKDIDDLITRDQSIHVTLNNRIVGHICFMRTQIEKLELNEISNKFKMANTILPLFSTKQDTKENKEKINSIYIPIFYICEKLNPLQRIEITKILLQTVINSNHRENDSIVTVSNIYDRAIERGLESFISITKHMQVISFSKKDAIELIDKEKLETKLVV